MNETLIFFKTWVVLKNNQDWRCIYQKKKSTIDKAIIFFKIVPMRFSTIIPASFLLVEASLKLLFRHHIKLHLVLILLFSTFSNDNVYEG